MEKDREDCDALHSSFAHLDVEAAHRNVGGIANVTIGDGDSLRNEAFCDDFCGEMRRAFVLENLVRSH